MAHTLFICILIKAYGNVGLVGAALSYALVLLFRLKMPWMLDIPQLYIKNTTFFETFFAKVLHGRDFCLTFASAFENERKLNENDVKFVLRRH